MSGKNNQPNKQKTQKQTKKQNHGPPEQIYGHIEFQKPGIAGPPLPTLYHCNFWDVERLSIMSLLSMMAYFCSKAATDWAILPATIRFQCYFLQIKDSKLSYSYFALLRP